MCSGAADFLKWPASFLTDLPEWLRRMFAVISLALHSGPSLLIDVCHAQLIPLCSINIFPELITGVSEGPCHSPSRRHIWFLATMFISPETHVFILPQSHPRKEAGSVWETLSSFFRHSSSAPD